MRAALSVRLHFCLLPFYFCLPRERLAFASAQCSSEEFNDASVVCLVLFGGGGGEREAGEREVCVGLDVRARGEAARERLGRLPQRPRVLAGEQEHLPVAHGLCDRAGRLVLVVARKV